METKFLWFDKLFYHIFFVLSFYIIQGTVTTITQKRVKTGMGKKIKREREIVKGDKVK